MDISEVGTADAFKDPIGTYVHVLLQGVPRFVINVIPTHLCHIWTDQDMLNKHRFRFLF